MKAVCAWCESEGKPAALGEREPFDDERETHGICDRHRREVLMDLYARANPEIELILVVRPDESKLYQYLTRSFAEVRGIQVVVDRRQGDRRRGEGGYPAERRAGDRRVHVPELHPLGHRIVRFGKT